MESMAMVGSNVEKFVWPLSSATTCYSGGRRCCLRQQPVPANDSNSHGTVGTDTEDPETRAPPPPPVSLSKTKKNDDDGDDKSSVCEIYLASHLHTLRIQIPFSYGHNQNSNTNNSNNATNDDNLRPHHQQQDYHSFVCESQNIPSWKTWKKQQVLRCVGYAMFTTTTTTEEDGKDWEALALIRNGLDGNDDDDIIADDTDEPMIASAHLLLSHDPKEVDTAPVPNAPQQQQQQQLPSSSAWTAANLTTTTLSVDDNNNNHINNTPSSTNNTTATTTTTATATTATTTTTINTMNPSHITLPQQQPIQLPLEGTAFQGNTNTTSIPNLDAMSEATNKTNNNNNNDPDKNHHHHHHHHRALLVLRPGNPTTKNTTSQWDLSSSSSSSSFTTTLPFRPLAIAVGMIRLSFPNPKRTLSSYVPVIWSGSADSCHIYAFVPNEKTKHLDALSLPTVTATATAATTADSPDKASTMLFRFTSPVMAMDYICYRDQNYKLSKFQKNSKTSIHSESDDDDDGHPDEDDDCGDVVSCLAVACQDGTIQLVRFSSLYVSSSSSSASSSNHWKCLHFTTVVVDGPLVCLQLSSNGQSIHALVGSLCGYVLCLSLDLEQQQQQVSSNPNPELDHRSSEWKGPFLVAQGLWNSHMNTEDSVLAVFLFPKERIVAFGTHSGRCFLYHEKSNHHDHHWTSIWECRLPYSIHGICGFGTIPNLCLIITTRKSVHVLDPFSPQPQLLSWKVAQSNLQKLHNATNKQDSHNT